MLPMALPLRFQDSAKIRELISKTPTRWTLAERQAFEFGIATGNGRCDVQLTMEQLKALKDRPAVKGEA